MPMKRLQFDITDEDLRELDELRETARFSTRAELFRHALALLRWTFEKTTQEGGTLVLKDRNGESHNVVFPIWQSQRQATSTESSGGGHSPMSSAANT